MLDSSDDVTPILIVKFSISADNTSSTMKSISQNLSSSVRVCFIKNFHMSAYTRLTPSINNCLTSANLYVVVS